MQTKKVLVGECWEWKRSRTKAGYGQLMVNGRMSYAHRVAYQLFVGRLKQRDQLDHLCRNRGCFNPDHLEPVTCRENLLRGQTKVAENTAKTHCSKGHPFDDANTLVLDGQYGPKRKCRTCHALREWARPNPGKTRIEDYAPYKRE